LRRQPQIKPDLAQEAGVDRRGDVRTTTRGSGVKACRKEAMSRLLKASVPAIIGGVSSRSSTSSTPMPRLASIRTMRSLSLARVGSAESCAVSSSAPKRFAGLDVGARPFQCPSHRRADKTQRTRSVKVRAQTPRSFELQRQRRRNQPDLDRRHGLAQNSSGADVDPFSVICSPRKIAVMLARAGAVGAVQASEPLMAVSLSASAPGSRIQRKVPSSIVTVPSAAESGMIASGRDRLGCLLRPVAGQRSFDALRQLSLWMTTSSTFRPDRVRH
jgi:hypothetical protein